MLRLFVLKGRQTTVALFHTALFNLNVTAYENHKKSEPGFPSIAEVVRSKVAQWKMINYSVTKISTTHYKAVQCDVNQDINMLYQVKKNK